MSTTDSNTVSVSQLPYGMLLEHTDTIRAMALGGLRSVLPFKRAQPAKSLRRTERAPSSELLTAYRSWSNATESDGVPPHLVCAKLTMPMVADLTAQAPYPLLSVLNQGVRLRLLAPVPEGEDLVLHGKLLQADDDGYRARIHSRIEVGTKSVPHAMTVDAIAAVMLKKRPVGTSSARMTEPRFETIGTWQGAWNEGQTFFWLTGDFNPIHTVPLFARRTRFQGCIMHGYGAFAQAYEALLRAESEFRDIETRFIRPLPLPSPKLHIQRALESDDEGKTAFRIIDEAGILYHAGSFR